jgi:TatD DNase family protein
LGLYISIAGIITFKNAQAIRDTVRDAVPMDRLCIETDAPFLAPLPHRGKRNEPAFVANTNRLISELKQVTEAEAATASTENFFRLFSKARA